MGDNAAYTAFEAAVIGAYDLGKLDRDLLAVLMEPYRGTDIDSGGSRYLQSKDGKGVEQIVIETMGEEMPTKPSEPYPKGSWKDFTPEQQLVADDWITYGVDLSDRFRMVTRSFGWW